MRSIYLTSATVHCVVAALLGSSSQVELFQEKLLQAGPCKYDTGKKTCLEQSGYRFLLRQ